MRFPLAIGIAAGLAALAGSLSAGPSAQSRFDAAVVAECGDVVNQIQHVWRSPEAGQIINTSEAPAGANAWEVVWQPVVDRYFESGNGFATENPDAAWTAVWGVSVNTRRNIERAILNVLEQSKWPSPNLAIFADSIGILSECARDRLSDEGRTQLFEAVGDRTCDQKLARTVYVEFRKIVMAGDQSVADAYAVLDKLITTERAALNDSSCEWENT